VGVYVVGSVVHGCECKGHDTRRERLRKLLAGGG
jgi:hypothetical protein